MHSLSGGVKVVPVDDDADEVLFSSAVRHIAVSMPTITPTHTYAIAIFAQYAAARLEFEEGACMPLIMLAYDHDRVTGSIMDESIMELCDDIEITRDMETFYVGGVHIASKSVRGCRFRTQVECAVYAAWVHDGEMLKRVEEGYSHR